MKVRIRRQPWSRGREMKGETMRKQYFQEYGRPSVSTLKAMWRRYNNREWFPVVLGEQVPQGKRVPV